MDNLTEADLRQLADLRSSGAITADQYDRLTAPVLDSATGLPQASRESRQNSVARPVHGPSMVQVLAAGSAGAIAGTLAADLFRNAVSDPPPEVLKARIEVNTNYIGDGYFTEADITWENEAGELVAEGTYSEVGTWEENAAATDPQETFSDSGGSFGGFDF